MKNKKWLALMFLVINCQTDPKLEDSNLKIEVPMGYNDIMFITLSDIHYLSSHLYDNGEAFLKSVNSRKGNLTEYGDDILDILKETVELKKPSFIMITGDLTYEGELQSHYDLVSKLKDIEDMDIPVYVIPGNHDINNDSSYSFFGNESKKVPNLTAGQFLKLYGTFGYDTNAERDLSSLSYSDKIGNEILLIGLDSCLYGKNYGWMRKSTLIWLEGQLDKARESNRLPLVFLHHSLLEHYEGQNKDRDILRNRKTLLELLHKYQVRTVFTGHYHAQNIAKVNNDIQSIYDIQTGSLFNWPFVYRTVVISGNSMLIRSSQLDIESLNQSGKVLTYSRIYNFSFNFLKKYGLNEENAIKIATYVSEIFFRHILGDENRTPLPEEPTNLSLFGKLALVVGRNLYMGRQYDSSLPDNNININLENGDYWE